MEGFRRPMKATLIATPRQSNSAMGSLMSWSFWGGGSSNSGGANGTSGYGSQTSGKRDEITWAEFGRAPNTDYVTGSNEFYGIPCLNICYDNGFQSWALNNPNDITEIISLHTKTTIYKAAFIAPPLIKTREELEEFNKINSKFPRPWIGIINKDEEDEQTLIFSIYSIDRSTKAINLIFNSTSAKVQQQHIFNFSSNNLRHLVLTSNERIYVFDLMTLKFVTSFHVYPLKDLQHPIFDSVNSVSYEKNASFLSNVSGFMSKKNYFTSFRTIQNPFIPPYDMSSNLLAFPPNFPIDPTKFNCDDQDRTALKKVARAIYDQIPYFSSVDPNTVPEEFTSQPPCPEAVGTIAFYDLTKNRIVYHFKPHGVQIGFIKWDPTGTLLLTGDAEARSFHVYSVKFDAANTHHPINVKMIYNLQCGLKTRVISSVEFSRDSRWIVITSTRGTSHMYPIIPNGKTPEFASHGPSKDIFGPQKVIGPTEQESVTTLPYISENAMDQSDEKFVYIYSNSNVKRNSFLSVAGESNNVNEKALFSHTVSFVSQRFDYAKIVFWVFDNNGFLSLYSLKVTKTQPAKSSGILSFGESTPQRDFSEEITRETTWDVCRKAMAASVSPSVEADKVNSIDYICPAILSPSAAAPPPTWNRSIEGSTCNPRDLHCTWRSFLTFGVIDPSDLKSEADETTKCEIIKI